MKAETVSFLHVSLVLGSKLTSLLIKRGQSLGFVLEYFTLFAETLKKSDKEIYSSLVLSIS